MGWKNVKIILISEFNLQNRRELLREEDTVIQLHLDNNKCLNVKRPYYGLEPKEQKKLHKELTKGHIKEASKTYYDKHQQKILEYNRQYRETNKEQVSEGKKLWYQKNKENVKQKSNKETEICICGSEILKVFMNRHLKSQMHSKLLPSLVK